MSHKGHSEILQRQYFLVPIKRLVQRTEGEWLVVQMVHNLTKLQ